MQETNVALAAFQNYIPSKSPAALSAQISSLQLLSLLFAFKMHKFFFFPFFSKTPQKYKVSTLKLSLVSVPRRSRVEHAALLII